MNVRDVISKARSGNRTALARIDSFLLEEMAPAGQEVAVDARFVRS